MSRDSPWRHRWCEFPRCTEEITLNFIVDLCTEFDCQVESYTEGEGPGGVLWVDADCDGSLTTRDNQSILRVVLQQNPLSQTQPCAAIGTGVGVGGFGELGWADADCDGLITSRDNQALMRAVLQQNALSQTEPCPDVGASIVLS